MKDIVDDIEIKDNNKYYGENFWCPNCGKRNFKYIRKGILLNDVMFTCYHCGCEVKGRCYHG